MIGGVKNRIRITRVHQVATDEVYGDLPLDRPELLFTVRWFVESQDWWRG